MTPEEFAAALTKDDLYLIFDACSGTLVHAVGASSAPDALLTLQRGPFEPLPFTDDDDSTDPKHDNGADHWRVVERWPGGAPVSPDLLAPGTGWNALNEAADGLIYCGVWRPAAATV